MYYINVRTNEGVQTVDNTLKYADAMYLAQEYNRSDTTYYYYVSTRSTKEWREECEKVKKND